MTERPLIHIIDGSGYIFRAYYAIPRLTSTVTGEPTNAVLGFTTMIQRVLNEEKPEYLAITFDAGRKTFRQEIYPDYKAHRPPPPEDLVPQIPRIHQVVEAFRLPLYVLEGWEADDLIATLARQAVKRGFDVRIVTGDKDLMQLVDDRICLYDPMKNKRFGPADVVERFGVGASHVADVLALAGDSTDNVPGVPGIGEKTASKLLLEHGNLDHVLAAAKAGKIKGKLGENLVAKEADARMSRRLVGLEADAPVELDLTRLHYEGPDTERQLGLFEELEFRRLLPNRGANLPQVEVPRPQAYQRKGPAEVFDHAHYTVIANLAGVSELVERIKKAERIGIAVESGSTRMIDADVYGIAIALAPGEVSYLPLGHAYLGCPPQLPLEATLKALRPVLEDAAIQKVSGTSKTVTALLLNHGIELRGLAFDTTLGSYLLDPDEIAHDLPTVSRRFLGHDPPSRDGLTGKGRTKLAFYQLPLQDGLQVVGEEADVAWRASKLMEEPLVQAEVADVMNDIELPLVPVLARMELAGVRVDTQFLREMSGTFATELTRLEQACYAAAGKEFNIGSPKQLQKILFEELGLRIVKRTKTGPSTDAAVLEELVDSHELPKAILDYRQVQKLKSTYVDALPDMVSSKTGRVHTTLSQAVAATGRLSSTDPNLQNIPIRSELGRQLRRAFIADPGQVLISVDYSQIELRVLAHFTEEPVLVEAFRLKEDVHTRTASVLFEIDPKQVSREQRTQAKAVNFGVLYGMGPVRLARDLGIQRRVASKFIDDYFIRQPSVKHYWDTTLESARNTGCVRTLFGRRRFVRDVSSKNRGIRGQAERMAVNTPIQGSAADLIKLAMIRVQARLTEEFPEARLILQVHDELLLESPEKQAAEIAALVRTEMEGAFPLKVPLVADPHIGRNWDEAH